MSSDVALQTEMPSHVNNLELLSEEKGPEDISGSQPRYVAGGRREAEHNRVPGHQARELGSGVYRITNTQKL